MRLPRFEITLWRGEGHKDCASLAPRTGDFKVGHYVPSR